ncbi:MAG: Cob(I)yrinic acid a,c-diamide adenosyltransferase [Phycisphaerae bacterium]|nr:Cob(I)yrinic acid a,c-diamide adenosyltransferase [Phycisphaerae bacterium]
MPRLTRIYTRTGDDGGTHLGGGQRVAKNALRIETFGTVDELNSQLGCVRASGVCPLVEEVLKRVQNELFHLGSDLCILEEDKPRMPVPTIEARHVETMERDIDQMSTQLPPLENFTLPGGSSGAAALHVARTVCRRAERLAVALAASERIGAFVVAYLNRLSDALFVMARFENHARGVAEPIWDSRA